jgi:predicted amidohydrolase YtcJ
MNGISNRRARAGRSRPGAGTVVLVLAMVACASDPKVSRPATDETANETTPAEITSKGPASTSGDVTVFLGRIITLADPAEVEAIAVRDGRVIATGDVETVTAAAGPTARIIRLGANVVYPGFVDAHSHWIGDRVEMGLDEPRAAINAALERGWTSIGELFVNPERMEELQALDAAGNLGVRVDGYLAMNNPAPEGEHLGDWYEAYRAGLAPSDRLRFPGVKFTIDNGWGSLVWWEATELAATVAAADAAGWQVAIHTISTEAHEMVLDAFEVTLAGRPNDRRHRIEHAVQVTDEQLQRIVDLDLVTVVHLAGTASDFAIEGDYLRRFSEPGDSSAWLTRWRDFVDAGISVAAGVDAPWLFRDFALEPGVGTPMDLVAGAMDGVGHMNPDPPTWVLDQTMTADQALAVLARGAEAIGDAEHRGRLVPGSYADITILSGDITDGTPADIRKLEVVATIVGGIGEFCADRAMCP